MNASRPSFQTRALISVLTGFAFLFLAASGMVLFLSPPGRVANWTNWTILGLRKSDWTGLHVWFSAVFLVGVIIHLVYNLRPLLSYFRNRVSRQVGFRSEWVVAGVVCGVVAAGTLAGITPFANLIAWNESLKESWDRAEIRAPIPHAELLTLAALAEKAGVDVPTAVARLGARGISGFSSETVVQKIADSARISAQQVFSVISSGKEPAESHTPAAGGIGWKTLAQFCSDEGIEISTALGRLNTAGITASADKVLRDIARENGGRKPYEIVDLIRGS